MPAIRPNLDGGGGEKRTTFRPPWVKDGPCPLPCPPTNPWLQQAKQEKKEAAKNVPTPTPLKKPKEKEIKINVEPEKNKEVNKPKEKEIKINIEREKPKEVNTPKTQPKEKEVKVERIKDVPPKKPEPSRVKEPVVKKVEFNPKTEERIMEPIPPQAPVPPPPPPMAPPPPPPQAKLPAKPVSKEKALKLDALRSRPRRRPDWTDMMKEVEQGIKLKHVQCNDRSAPVLPNTKTKGQFVYESETQNSHNVLLKEIQKGVHLKKTKTNDRSRPNLEGLRKFRRQMTIEEIITKSASVADVVAVASQPDELDDIDKVRDDLQSTKQMLALELRNKEALERENKRLLARLTNLEAELEKEKLARSSQEQGPASKLTRTAEDDKLISRLKEEAAQSAAMTKEMEEKYHQTAEELDLTRAKLESAWLKNAQLEMELKSKGKYNPPLTKQLSTKKMPTSASEKKIHGSAPVNKEAEDSDTVTESETEEEEEEEESNETTSAATQEERELKLLNNKLKTLKEKKATASNEKKNLKSQLSKLQHVLKEEKKKYKLLQKEVEKMASLMKDVEGDEEEEEEEEDEADEEDEEETETESESEEEVAEEEVPDDASHHEKVRNLNSRIRTFESLLTRAKKGNYLLKANIERKQDDVNRQKEMSLALQEDLNAVLSELG